MMSSAASVVFVGAAPPGGVASPNRIPQGLPSPATPPAELTQAASEFAKLYSSAVGTV